MFNVIYCQQSSAVWQYSLSPVSVSFLKQPHSIVQRRLLEGNITRLRGEARDASARVRSPLADTKDGQADAEERSESTAEDSTEERESLEESEKSLRSDEEDDSSEATARQTAEKTEGTESSNPLTALLVQCKVLKLRHLLHKNRDQEDNRALLCSPWLIPLRVSLWGWQRPSAVWSRTTLTQYH